MAPRVRLYITPEPPDDTVGGTFTLNAELTELPAAASVEYLLNGRSLSGPVQTAAPFAFRWNSAETWDGPAAFRAVVRDARGEAIAESGPAAYRVVNGRTQILVAGLDAGRPLSGTARITVRARRPDARVTYREATPPDYAAIAFRLFVDGRLYPHPVSGLALAIEPAESTDHLWATHTFVVDTTRLANGPHEFSFTAEAVDERVVTHAVTVDATGRHAVVNVPVPPAEAKRPPGTVAAFDITTRYVHPMRVAMAQHTVTVENGAALLELRPRWRELHLALRGGPTSAALPVRAVHADGSERALDAGVAYASSNPAVAAVSAAGVVRAVAPGEAVVTAAALGRSADVRVRVRAAATAFPHFTRDGEIRTTVERGRSVFVRSLFFIDHREFGDREAALGAQLRAAGVNAISAGFIFPPTGATTFAAWRDDWERVSWGPLRGIAERQGLALLLTGDSMARLRTELLNSVTNPTAGEAIAYAFGQLAASGRVIAVDMIDEANMMWGPTPRPAAPWPASGPDDGTGVPAVPADAFVRLMASVNRAPRRPPVAFPVLGSSGVQAVANWLGDPAFSDYASIYFVLPAGDDWRAYPFGASLPQEAAGRTETLRRWRPALQRDRPVLLIHGTAGPAYEKRAAGADYQPNRDELHAVGSQVVAAAAGVLYAVAEGMAGVRVYGFDARAQAKLARRESAPWTGAEQQTFADPFETGTDRWQALGSAFALIERREALALQPQRHAPHLGAGIVTGVRGGPEGTMVVAVSFAERAESVRVDLSPYRAAGAACVRYELLGASLGSRAVEGAADAVTLAPGMGAVWVVLPAGTAAPTIRLVTPRSGARVAGRVSILAEAESSGRPIARVELRVDEALVATHQPPAGTFAGSFHATWDSATAPRRGVWLGVTARVYDAAGTMEEARGAVLVV